MTDKRSLRLATWNIHMSVGLDGKRELARTARVIQQISPDLIGLQEVDNHIKPDGNDLERLSELTAMSAVAGPTMQRKTGDYGNALLTKLPILKIERHDLSVRKREPRGLLIVHHDWFGKEIKVAVTHLGLRPTERRIQVRRLIDCLSAENQKPLFLMGDFNEWLFWGRPMLWLHNHFGSIQSPKTFPSRWPLFRLDHILADPPRFLSEKEAFQTPLSRVASDHLPVVANYSCQSSIG